MTAPFDTFFQTAQFATSGRHALDDDFVRDQLAQRALDVNGKRHNPEGEYVLYWIQSTQRLDENWALRAAIRAADRVNRPLIIHQGVDPTYPYAADRHHFFLLQGARDTALRARALGLHYQFVLRASRDDDRRVVDRLASRAYLVITDLFPTAGIGDRTKRFAERVSCRVLAVDGSCVVPSGLFPKAEFAARTIRPRLARVLEHSLEEVRDHAPRVAVSDALAQSLAETIGVPVINVADLSDDELADCVRACAIDHSVARIPGLAGGSAAGAQKMQAFVEGALDAYNDARNNASLVDATSGLSPWLHFGHVPAAAVVRAAQRSGAAVESVEAFVQQVVTWRELSFNWCLRTANHDQLVALPNWVQQTMSAHAADARPTLYDFETLERAQTHDAFWNAAQRQLVETGVIHNYARMLWGKCLVLWTPDYETARAWMFRLNDKWALDGRDPNSVGGIMWCLGLWDRPWGNKPVWGGLRPMLTSRVHRKFDTAGYLERFAPRS